MYPTVKHLGVSTGSFRILFVADSVRGKSSYGTKEYGFRVLISSCSDLSTEEGKNKFNHRPVVFALRETDLHLHCSIPRWALR